MKVAEEWMLWADEKTVNRNNQDGLYPKIERNRGYNTNTKLFYCYYTRGSQDSDDGSYSMLHTSVYVQCTLFVSVVPKNSNF